MVGFSHDSATMTRFSCFSWQRSASVMSCRFLARFRDDDTVLVLQLGTISERDVLMQLDPRAFFFTEHYRDYPAVLIRLAEVPRSLFADVVTESWRHVAAMRPARRRHSRFGSLHKDGL